jgi:UDP-3-O-[3-hydroxymyristoyl] glucosamine N-acyltransferase
MIVTLDEIKQVDKDLEFVKENVTDFNYIGHFLMPESSRLYFCKNAKFARRYMESFAGKGLQKLGLVTDKKFYETKGEEFKEFFDSFETIALSNNVDVSISFISKPFHDKKYEGINTQVDGRKLGTAEIHPTARISENVFIGDNVKIGANSVIYPNVTILANSEIGENTSIFPNSTVYHDCKIGDNVRIHSCSVIGADGFGYNFKDGIHHKVWHFSGVIIEDNVEIGASSAVDAGAFIPTRVGAGSIIDNMNTIGHNSQVGKGLVMVAMSGIAGSCRVGNYVVMGGRSTLGPDVQVGDGTQIASMGVAVTDWPAGSTIAGHPGRDHKEWLRTQAVLRRLALKKD